MTLIWQETKRSILPSRRGIRSLLGVDKHRIFHILDQNVLAEPVAQEEQHFLVDSGTESMQVLPANILDGFGKRGMLELMYNQFWKWVVCFMQESSSTDSAMRRLPIFSAEAS